VADEVERQLRKQLEQAKQRPDLLAEVHESLRTKQDKLKELSRELEERMEAAERRMEAAESETKKATAARDASPTEEEGGINSVEKLAATLKDQVEKLTKEMDTLKENADKYFWGRYHFQANRPTDLENRTFVLETSMKNMFGLTLAAKAANFADETPCGVDENMMDQHMNFIMELWHGKKGNVLDELCYNMRQPDKRTGEGDQAEVSSMSITDMALLCCSFEQHQISKHAKDSREDLQKKGIDLAGLVLYTMPDVDIDRALGFKCPDVPQGSEAPKERDAIFKQYRSEHNGKRNLEMFRVMNKAARDSMNERKDSSFSSLKPWIKWLCFLGVSTEKKPHMRLFRGLSGLDERFMEEYKEKKPDDVIYWPALASCSDSEEVPMEYMKQDDKGGRLLFEISEVSEALSTAEFSQYPGEREFVLPPFSKLVVVGGKRDDQLGAYRVICKFEGCLMPESFKVAVLQDLARARIHIDVEMRNQEKWSQQEKLFSEFRVRLSQVEGLTKSLINSSLDIANNQKSLKAFVEGSRPGSPQLDYEMLSGDDFTAQSRNPWPQHTVQRSVTSKEKTLPPVSRTRSSPILAWSPYRNKPAT
jgi:hypothetical protein